MGRDTLIWPGKAEAALSITFDDGYGETLENTCAWLSSRQIRATYFITTEKTGAIFDGLPTASWEDIRRADQLGHEIACHGASHAPLDDVGSDFRRLAKGVISAPDRVSFIRQAFTRMNQIASRYPKPNRLPIDLNREIVETKREVEKQLPGRLVESFAYPGGRYNRAAQKALASVGFRSGRSLDPGVNRRAPKWFALKAIALGPGMRQQDIEHWIAAARQQSGWLILVLHLVTQSHPGAYPYACSCEDFQELIDFLQKNPLYIAPQGEVTRFLQEQLE